MYFTSARANNLVDGEAIYLPNTTKTVWSWDAADARSQVKGPIILVATEANNSATYTQ